MNPTVLYNNRYLIYNSVIIDLQRSKVVDVEIPETNTLSFIKQHYNNLKHSPEFDKLQKYAAPTPTSDEPYEIVLLSQQK